MHSPFKLLHIKADYYDYGAILLPKGLQIKSFFKIPLGNLKKFIINSLLWPLPSLMTAVYTSLSGNAITFIWQFITKILRTILNLS